MPTRRTTTRMGVELVYWTWPGEGPPALLLHGIGTYGRSWDLFADAVAGRLRLIADGPARFATPGTAGEYLERTSPGYSEGVYRNRLEWLFRSEGGELVWRSDPHALAEIMRSRTDPTDRWVRLRTIAAPTLIV